jgi:hypothetical protein
MKHIPKSLQLFPFSPLPLPICRPTTGSKKIHSAKTKAVKDDMSSEGEVEETDYIGGRYLVRPHPLRGFRHWAVSRKMLVSLTRYVESWASSEQGPLLVGVRIT